MAGYDGVMPASLPETYDDIDPSMYDADARLRFLDEQGIRAQVLYPNVGGFGNGYFLRLGDRDLVAQCVRAVQRLPHRLVQRRSRAAARGHRAAVLGRRPRPSPSCTAASRSATAR